MNQAYATPDEKTISGALALVMHLLFFVLLVFGVNWQQKQTDSAVIVDLWNNLPPLPQPKVELPPVAKVKPPPEPPKPEPRVGPKPAPKPEPKPEVKPDIALKEKLEKERKQKEQERIEQERKRKELEKREAKKREEEKERLAALKEKQAKEAEAKSLKEQEDAALRKLAQQQAAQLAAQAKMIDEYKSRIRDKIKRFIVEPPSLNPNAQVEFDIVILPGGEVLSAKLKRSSNSMPAYDNAVERAILRAQPLPLPPDPALIREFREMTLRFWPEPK